MEYSIEELAATANERIDTIRYYQAKGLLARPKREGRKAVYSSEHLAVIRKIRDYQSQGLTLALIERLINKEANHDSSGEALLKAVENETGKRSLTRTELAAQSGLPEALLLSLETAGLLVPLKAGDDDSESAYSETDVEMAKAALTLLGEGFPIDELLNLAVTHVRSIESLCEESITLFDQHVRKNKQSSADATADIAESFRKLLPAVTTLVALHFQRTLLRRALDRLRNAADDNELNAAVAVVKDGQLEVRWK